MSSSSAPVVLITGANTGIGYESVRALLASNTPHIVLLGCRSPDKGAAAAEAVKKEHPETKSTVEVVQIDIEDDASIARCYEEVSSRHGRLDALVNNAGGQFDPAAASGEMSVRQMWDRSWSVNVTSTYAMTAAMVPLLIKGKSPRLLFVTSGTSTLAGTDNPDFWLNKSPPAGWPKANMGLMAYRSSKTGMNMMFREWHRLLVEDGVHTFAISPGFLATGLGGSAEKNKQNGAGDPALGGKFICDVVEGRRDADRGKIITRDGIQAY